MIFFYGIFSLLFTNNVSLRFIQSISPKSSLKSSAPNEVCELAAEGTVECGATSTPKQSVWTVFGELATKTGASNLGQGFPDWDPPPFVMQALRETVDTKFHQYTRPAGHPPLAELLAARYSKHLNRNVDPFNEVAVTVGASQALYLALMTCLEPSDEIVLFEPFFDLYVKQIKLTRASAKFVALGGNAATLEDPWALDVDALRRAITPKTKILILNSPHNPTGKVFTQAELEAIASIVREHPNLIVVSDEVYKFSIYDPLEEGDPTVRGHYHFARLPDMWDRTITLSSCGKTFSVTGWQVGWMVGPTKYIQPVHELLPCVQFNAATPIQHALTLALPEADKPYRGHSSYYEWMRVQFQSKRAILEKGLLSVGISPLPSRGGFFLMGQLPTHWEDHTTEVSAEPYDWRFCRTLGTEYGVIGIPASPFFSQNSLAVSRLGPMARFAFCKKDATMIDASNRLISKSKAIRSTAANL